MLGYEDIIMDLCGADAETKLQRYVASGIVENLNAPEQDPRRRTLLHVACSGPTEMCLSCVRLLLQASARTNVITGEAMVDCL
jgi:hypothetical protein